MVKQVRDKQRVWRAWMLILSVINVPHAIAGPDGGQVVDGSGSIAHSDNTTTINQTSQNMAIDWQSYNVDVDERVQYVQPNQSSISLNNILSNSASEIRGHIDANGQVILVNPNGVFFTPTAVINVGGIIASGLAMYTDDFMNGRYIFNEVLGAEGAVINRGTINAALGGNVALIGKQVENDGLIVASLGSVSLAAGKQAVLTFDQDGLLGVRVSKEILQEEVGLDPAVINGGDIEAEGGRVLLTASTSQNVFSQAVNIGAIEQASSVVVHEDGSFTLGGGADVINTGSIDVSTTGNDQNPNQDLYQSLNQSTGRIVLLGENVTSSGELRADAANGNGGEIELHAQDTTRLTDNSVTSARSEINGQGGIVKVLGDKVGLFDQAMVDVSGVNGGGQALIGGDYLGANTGIRNAMMTVVGRETALYADALQRGNGGKVILWSDQNTYFGGNIAVRGGAQSGHGGFVETSGKVHLLFDGNVDLSANSGDNGLLLLDPLDIAIVSGDDSSGTKENSELTTIDWNVFFDDGSNLNFDITANRIELILASGNVQLSARRDIDINADINTGTNSNNLTLLAGDDITVSKNINLDSGDLLMIAGSASCQSNCDDVAGGGGGINIGRNIYIEGQLDTTGSIDLYAADHVIIDERIGNSLEPNAVMVRAGDSILVNALNNGNSIEPNGSSNGGRITASGVVSLTAADAALQTDQITINTVSGSVTTAITVAPTNNAVVTGSIEVEGDITTNGGDFIAATATGYFDNWWANQNLDAGAGAVLITANGNTLDGNNRATGAFLGDITAGSLSVTTTAGQIVQSINAARNLVISGASSFNAGTNFIDLQNDSNNLQGAISLSTGGTGADAMLNNTAVTTTLDVVNISGKLIVNAEQGLALADNITVTDTAEFNFAQDNNDGHTFAVSSGLTLAASAITVSGGTGDDVFDIASTVVGNLDGSSGVDTFNLGANVTGIVDGGNGDDIFNMNAAGLSLADLRGGADNDTLNGHDSINIWTINAANGGTLVNGLQTSAFTEMENLNGALNNDDTFSFSVMPTVGDMAIDGQGQIGQDSVNLSALTGPISVQLGATGFNNIELITGNNTNSTLIGTNAGNTWNITAENDGNVGTLNFVDFNNLTGGTGNDIFNLGANVTGTVDGGLGIDTFNITANLTGILMGSAGNDIFNINAAGLSLTDLRGGTDNDTLNGHDSINIWSIDKANGGTLVNGIQTSAFTEMENINGGDGTDTFAFLANGSLSGLLDAGVGTDSVDMSALTVVDITLGQDIVNIESITGNNINSTLRGTGAVNAFILNGTNNGSLDGSLAFSGFNHLDGGGENDTFTFQANSSLSGLLDGGAGNNDSVDMSALAVVDITLGQGLANIESITGNNTNSTLRGTGAVNAFVLSGANNGSLDSSLAFVGFNHLDGGGDNDTFTFQANSSLSGLLDGGDGNNDSVDMSALAVVDITLGQGLANIESITGNGTNSTLTGTDVGSTWNITGENDGDVGSLNFVNFNNLVGGTGDDIFILAGTGVFDGSIAAGDGDDRLQVTLAGIQNGQLEFQGGSGVNRLSLDGASNSGVGYEEVYKAFLNGGEFIFTGNGNTYGIVYSGVDNIQDDVTANLSVQGSAANDTFQLAANSFVISNSSIVPVNYANKTGLAIAGLGGEADEIILQDNLSINGRVTLSAESVVNSSGYRITANELALNGVNSAGSAGARILTNIDNLYLADSGSAYLSELNALTLAQMSATGVVDILADGTVNNSAGLASGHELIIDSNADINLGQVNQFSGPLRLSAIGDVNLANSVDINLASVSANTLTLTTSGSINSTGPVDVSGDANLGASGGNITFSGDTDFSTLNVVTHNIVLHDSNIIEQLDIAATGSVNVSAQNGLGVGSITANHIQLDAGVGQISDENGGAVNLVAPQVVLRAGTGIGDASNVLGTQTAELDVINTTGSVGIANSGAVTLRKLVTQGNINFTNNGNVTVDTVDAGYANSDGRLEMTVTNGSIVGTNRDYRAAADITANSALINTSGDFGAPVRPVSARINTEFILFSNLGSVYYFGGKPDIIIDNSTIKISIFDALLGLSGQQLIEVETLSQIDPAIFTEVRNYYQDEIAILLPADQRYEDDEENAARF